MNIIFTGTTVLSRIITLKYVYIYAIHAANEEISNDARSIVDIIENILHVYLKCDPKRECRLFENIFRWSFSWVAVVLALTVTQR